MRRAVVEGERRLCGGIKVSFERKKNKRLI
jgi:hypothetical protein